MNNGGPAFPRPLADAVGDALFSKLRDRGAPGMTLRDYFAAAALASSVSNMWESHKMEDVATRCYRYADAMLAAREDATDERV